MSTPDSNIGYYAARAQEYDGTSIYQAPPFAVRSAPMRARYQLALEGHDVLEVACGTGWWTRIVAQTARSIVATDVNPEVIEIAKSKAASFRNVRFQLADAYTLEGVEGIFTAAFAQFWWSHIPHRRLNTFLTVLHGKLAPGSQVLFMDSLPWEHDGGRRIDEEGDLIEERTLRDGRRFEIVKNFPRQDEVRHALKDLADDVVFNACPVTGTWTVTYRTRH